MKTHNYNIDLMTPQQINKEVLFNESIITLDSFCNSVITDFTKHLPTDPQVDQKYIISSGDNAGYIYYCPHPSKGWHLLKPHVGMIMFVQKKNSFYIFENHTWKMVSLGDVITQTTQNDLLNETESFKSVANKFEIPLESQNLYLYLNGNCQFDFSKSKSRESTIIIKQHYQNTFKTIWPNNILWKNKAPHQMTVTANSIDIIKFYQLVETKHFLAEIVGQDYKF
jgi:hypothetical protein